MQRHLPAFAVGFACAALLSGLLALQQARDKFAFGFGLGYLSAQIEIARQVPAALGDDYQPGDGVKPLFGVKDVCVVIVERNGIKTLRLYPPASPSPDTPNHGAGANAPGR